MDAKTFYPKLVKMFNDAGISFVILPYLSKSNIYGVTKWLNRNSVMLSVSNRGEKADNDTTKDGWGALIKLDVDERSVKHIFGNLALISAGRNSEYSNMPVGGKSDLIVRSVEKKSIEI